MRLRDLFVGTAVLCIATIHFAVQWLGWKAHLGDIALQGGLLGMSGESLWSFCSFPIFSVISRSTQHQYFFTLLVVNSVIWGLALVHGASSVGRSFSRSFRKRRPSRPAPPLTEAEQLAELRWLSERGMISAEQYRLRREVILAQKRGYLPSTEQGAPKPGTRVEPRRYDTGTAQHFDPSFAPARPLSRGVARGR